MLEIIALSAACLLAGLIMGIGIGQWRESRRDAAPLPEFDRDNPINAQARTEVINGVTWTVYGGRQ